MNLFLGLIHHPIRNKVGEKVTTSVTNMDIHDISRSCRTFGVEKYYIVTPLKIQQELVGRILGHWGEHKSLAYNPDRKDALSIACLQDDIDSAIQDIENITGERPLLVVTGANFKESNGDSADLIKTHLVDKRPIFLIFGTGWGLHQDVLDRADYFLGPIFGNAEDGYNHLSVRSAVAIYLDRLTQELK